MALHSDMARHAGSFGAGAVWNAAIAHSSEYPSPRQLLNDFWYKPDRTRHSVSSVFQCLIANDLSERRA